MFGMILKFQALMEKLKQNKRLWFTTLTVVSLLGVMGTLSYLNSTTAKAAKNLYEATNTNYFQDLDFKLTHSLEKIAILGTALSSNQNFMAVMNNPGNTAAVNEQLKKYAAEASSVGKNEIIIELYDQTGVKAGSSLENFTPTQEVSDSKALRMAIAKNEFTSTIEYQEGNVYLATYFPFGNGVLETKQAIDFLVDEYAQGDKIFQVLLDKDFLDMKKLQNYSFKKIGKSQISVQEKVDEDFLTHIAEMDFEKLIEEKYHLSDESFIMARPIMDVDNKRMGIILISENILKEDSLPNMTRSISTGITTAALGLVVSLLVLMI